MKQKLLTSLLLLIASISLMAQNVTVTGVVSDQVGPVIGASVFEKGTTNGTVTDLDGNFSISVRPGSTLVISSIGYASQEISVGSQRRFNVLLQEDREFLDEVVVVGYGTMKRSDLSGASVSMKEDDLRGSIITNLDQSLQGRAAGVTAVQTSGAPGSSSSIRVRGQATVNAGAEPLYVIDGVIVQGGGNSAWDYGLGDLGNGKISTISPLATLNPSDIVSMEILKDASATAIYGAQGANGVVLITTKHGRSGESKISYEGMFAVSQQNVRIDMLNLREWAEFYNDFVKLGEASANTYYADPSILGVGTNWQDEVFRTALQHQHQVSAQGGTDKVQYYVSGSYMNQEGTVIGTNFDRFSFRTNIDAQVKDWLKLGVNATYAITNDDLKLADGGNGLIFQSLGTLPDIPVYDLDGNYATVVREGYTSANPVGLAMINSYTLKREKLTGNIYAEITPFKDLVWRSEIGFDASNSQSDSFRPTYILGGKENKTNSMSVQKNASVYWQLKNYLTWSHSFGEHAVTGMIGQEAWESRWDYLSASNSNLPDNIVRSLSKATGDPTVGHGFGSSAMASFFTRWTYNYSDRYLATYTFRYDGSSNFGPDNRWAGFHSFAASWRFSNEPFLKDFAQSIALNSGKLRVGWGQTGNANIGGGAWEASIYDSYSALGDAQRPTNIPNTGIHWEKQQQINVGLDLSFFNSRLNFTIDAYDKKSSDMLMSLDLPSYMGTKGNTSMALAAPKGNFGTIDNKGIEITISGYPIQTRDFDWESNFQISFNKNKLIALDGSANAQLIGYGQWNDIVSVTEIGQPLYGFYGYKVVGVYKDFDDILNSPKAEKYPADGVFNRNTTVWPGDLKFADISGPDGKPDGVINEYDRTNIGSPLPLFTFGWTNTFRYKSFDLSIFFNGTYGNKVFNYNLMGQGYNGLSHMTSYWTNQQVVVKQRAQLVPVNGVYSDNWYDDITNVKVANPDTRMPRITTQDPNDNDRVSDRYIEDGSYIRVKNITLGYTFPSTLVRKLNIENIRLYVNIQNLFTLTKYTGYDPEVGASTQDATGMTFGVDNGRYPSPTTYSCGLNITF